MVEHPKEYCVVDAVLLPGELEAEISTDSWTDRANPLKVWNYRGKNAGEEPSIV